MPISFRPSTIDMGLPFVTIVDNIYGRSTVQYGQLVICTYFVSLSRAGLCSCLKTEEVCFPNRDRTGSGCAWTLRIVTRA